MRCRCCGAESRVDGLDAASFRGVCLICREVCDRNHGERLERMIVRKLSIGLIDMWHGIACAMMDDALITGRLLIMPPLSTERGATLHVMDPPPRWLVVAERAKASGEMVAIGDVVQAALAPYLRKPNVPSVRDAIERDLLAALTTIDTDIVAISCTVKRDVMDPEHLEIVIKKRINIEPGAVVMPGGETVEIPPDLLARARAKA